MFETLYLNFERFIMNIQRLGTSFALLFTAMLVSGCGETAATNTPATNSTAAREEEAVVLLSVSSDVNDNPQSVDMAMKFAGFALDENRKVVMFFSVKGVRIPTTSFADDLAFQEHEPIKKQLLDLIKRGADVHVCPVCMKALGIEAEDIIDGAQVTTRPKLFANIHGNTAVFTY